VAGSDDPYVQALVWLARRELSTMQVRARLARRGVEAEAIDQAVERLTRERALDDRRTALAYARSAVNLKGRARGRVLREIAALGIARPTADAAVQEVFGEIDEPALLEQALAKRWPRGRPLTLADKQRLYRALLRQGFPSGAIAAALRARRVDVDDVDHLDE
jgi:regulatory protein